MSLAGNADRLTVDIVEKTWPGGRQVLGPVSFALSAGEVVAISGPSGCGKSTLMSIVAGLDAEFRGHIRWADGVRLGIVFQAPRLLPWRTATQNVALALGGGRGAQHRARQALADVGLEEAAEAYPARLSLGMARRVALARALVREPDVLLLDEAFVSLDDRAADTVRHGVLAAVSRRGTSVLMVTHDAREQLLMADRQLVLGGAPTRLLAEHALARTACQIPGGRAISCR